MQVVKKDAGIQIMETEILKIGERINFFRKTLHENPAEVGNFTMEWETLPKSDNSFALQN